MNEKRTWESDVSDALDRRVRDLHDAPLSFEQVTTRARGIRRRRQAAVAGAVLAVAAVVAPVAVVVGSDGPGRDTDVPAATNAPRPTATDSAAPLPDNGPEPMIGRLEGSTFVRGDGVEFDLPAGYYTRADQLGAELVAYRIDQETGEGTIDVFDAPADGGAVQPVDSLQAVDGYATDPMGLVIAYRTPQGEVVVRWDGDQTSLGADFPESASPAALTGVPGCADRDGGCTVYLNVGDGSSEPISASVDGSSDVRLPPMQAVRDATSDGLLSVQTSNTEDDSCGGLYDSAAGRFLFETCDYSVGAISPSGAHVLAGPAYADGLGPTSIAILDREGFQVAGSRQVGGFIGSQTWEDPGHVVFTVYANGAWSVWRLGTDGKVEQLTDPVPGSDAEPPVQFFE